MNKLIASTLTLTMIALMGTTGIGMAGNSPGIEVAEQSAPVEESSDMQSAPEESMETDSNAEENAETDSPMTEEDTGVEEDMNDQSSLEQDIDTGYPAEVTEPEDYTPEQQSGVSDYGTESIYGTVTLVGDNVIKLQDSATGIGHTIHVSEKQEKELTTGFMIDAKVKDGKLVAFTQLDVPANVEEIVYSAENLS